MSLFKEHPCGNLTEQCSEYGKCNQFECDKFRDWFNEAYQDMMQMNVLYEQERLMVTAEPIKEHLIMEIPLSLETTIKKKIPDLTMKKVRY